MKRALFPSLFVGILSICLSACSSKPPLPVLATISDFKLTDQTGAEFSSASLKGKVWIADFIFTHCPGPCPRMSSQMHKVQIAFTGHDEVKLVSFTVDPARDTPEVLAKYSEHFLAEPGRWFFLTGPMAALNEIGFKSFKLNVVDGKEFDHSTRFALVDQNGNVRGYYLTSEESAIPDLISDARRLLKEHS
jgi:protein SCO1/2